MLKRKMLEWKNPPLDPVDRAEIKVEKEETAEEVAALGQAQAVQSIDEDIRATNPTMLEWFRLNYKALSNEAAELDVEAQAQIIELEAALNAGETRRQEAERMSEKLELLNEERDSARKKAEEASG